MANYIYPFPKGTPVTQLFGQNPGGNNPRGGHTAIDFAVPIGTPIWAACDGVIEFEGWVTGQWYENPWWFMPGAICIVLNAGPGKPSFTYGHLNETLVSNGQYVKKGQVIGYSGNTGISSGPHCHFEYIPDNWDYQNGTYGRLDPQLVCEYWDGRPDQPDILDIPGINSVLWGIDTSLYQGDIDIARINPDYVLVRATEGAGITDPWMEATARKTRNAGKRLGFYHYAHPMHLSGNTAQAEARYFIDAIKHLYRKGDKIILDWENRYSQLGNGQWALEWADQCCRELGATPEDVWFYSYPNVLTTNDAGLAIYRAKYPKLWLASYFTEELNTWGDPESVYGKPVYPRGWELVGWQYTQYGRVPGHNGNLDLSVIYEGADMALTDDDIKRWLNFQAFDPAPGEKPTTISQALKEVHELYRGQYFGGKSTPGEKPLTDILGNIQAKVVETATNVKALPETLGKGSVTPPDSTIDGEYTITIEKKAAQ